MGINILFCCKIKYNPMKKDFNKWNEVKKRTNAEDPRLYTVREIWWFGFLDKAPFDALRKAARAML